MWIAIGLVVILFIPSLLGMGILYKQRHDQQKEENDYGISEESGTEFNTGVLIYTNTDASGNPYGIGQQQTVEKRHASDDESNVGC